MGQILITEDQSNQLKHEFWLILKKVETGELQFNQLLSLVRELSFNGNESKHLGVIAGEYKIVPVK